MSGRAACRKDAALQTQTLTVRLILVSAETRRTSKKPDFCGLQPVDRNAEMEANLWTRTQQVNGRKVAELRVVDYQ